MTRFWYAACLGLALFALAGPTAAQDKDKKVDDEDKEIKEAQKDVLDLTKDVSAAKPDAKAIEAKAGKIKKKYEELNTVMHIYKPKDKGGIGYGKAGEGIELKIIGLGKRALAPAALTKEKDELVKLANINIAMAAITKHYAPTKTKGGKGKKDWEQHCEDMRKGAEALIKAVKGNTPAAVKAAANDLNNACNNCHTDFRDN